MFLGTGGRKTILWELWIIQIYNRDVDFSDLLSLDSILKAFVWLLNRFIGMKGSQVFIANKINKCLYTYVNKYEGKKATYKERYKGYKNPGFLGPHVKLLNVFFFCLLVCFNILPLFVPVTHIVIYVSRKIQKYIY